MRWRAACAAGAACACDGHAAVVPVRAASASLREHTCNGTRLHVACSVATPSATTGSRRHVPGMVGTGRVARRQHAARDIASRVWRRQPAGRVSATAAVAGGGGQQACHRNHAVGGRSRTGWRCQGHGSVRARHAPQNSAAWCHRAAFSQRQLPGALRWRPPSNPAAHDIHTKNNDDSCDSGGNGSSSSRSSSSSGDSKCVYVASQCTSVCR